MKTVIRNLAAIGLAVACLRAAGNEPRQKVEIAKTEHMEFVAGGTVRLENPIGELTVEGWDQPEVEITVVKSTKDDYPPPDREPETRRLERVRVTAERRAQEMVITTAYPRGELPPWPKHSAGYFDLEYEIHVPRTDRLVVHRGSGEVHVEGVSGDIDASVSQGLITVSLLQQGPYAIDAKSDFGGIVSDLPGRSHRKFWLFGNQFVQDLPAGAPKLRLRIGYGDITILKMARPPELAPAAGK